MTRLLASDIDGTLAPLRGTIPLSVTDRLKEMWEKGYNIYLVTGRNFTFAKVLLNNLDFPYFLSLQNGAVIVKMPEKKIVHRSYLDMAILDELEVIFENEPHHFILEGGIELDDTCFYKEERFSREEIEYFSYRKKISGTPWKSVHDYKEMGVTSFPLVKIFGEESALKRLQEVIIQKLNVHAPLIKDPFKDQSILMLTKENATKGAALDWFLKEEMHCDEVIVAGDDANDESMIEKGTYKIVMETAPVYLKAMADFIAPSADECGILEALKHL